MKCFTPFKIFCIALTSSKNMAMVTHKRLLNDSFRPFSLCFGWKVVQKCSTILSNAMACQCKWIVYNLFFLRMYRIYAIENWARNKKTSEKNEEFEMNHEAEYGRNIFQFFYTISFFLLLLVLSWWKWIEWKSRFSTIKGPTRTDWMPFSPFISIFFFRSFESYWN